MNVIYKITYPNGKIHIGKDLTDSITACMMVVLDNSEKAHEVFNEAVQAWGRKDCQSALSEVDKYITPSHKDRLLVKLWVVAWVACPHKLYHFVS